VNARTTLILLLIALGLGFYILRVDRHRLGTDQREAVTRRALLVNAAAIDRLVVIRDGGEPFGCELRQGAWAMLAPTGLRADASRVSRLLQKVERLRRQTVITAEQRAERGLTWADYGLENPRVRLQLSAQGVPTELWLGTTGTNAFPVYARFPDQSDILRVDDDTLLAVPASSQELRDRQVFHQPASAAVRVEITRPTGPLHLQRAEGGGWRLDQPTRARAAPDMANHLVDLLHTLRVEQFVADTDSGLGRYGLTDEAPTLRVFHEGAEYPIKLSVGASLPDQPGLCYARLHGVPAVFAVSEGLRRMALFEIEALRDRNLLGLPLADLAAVRITRPGGSPVGLRRGEGGRWTMTEPKPWPADEERLAGALAAWTAASVTDYPTPPREADLATFAGPQLLEIEFTPRTLPGGTEPARQTYQVFARAGMAGRALVRSMPDGLWTLVVPAELTATPVDVLYYRDRAVLQVAPEELREIFRRADGVETSLTRLDAAQPWTNPESAGEPDTETVSALIRLLNPLRAEDLVAFDPPDLSPWGLDAPTLSLTLGLAGETGISRTLLVAPPDPQGRVHAIIRGQEVVFRLSPEAHALLRRPLLKPSPPADGPAGARPPP
jgi:hypothetical protein